MPIDRRPVFPDRCVKCGGEPATTYHASTRAIGWWSFAFAAGKRHALEVPACAPCKAQMIWQRRIRFVVMIAFLVVGVIAGSEFLGGSGGWRRWAVGGIALAVLLPWIVWQMYWPVAFDMTARSDTIEYEFANAAYAEDFLAANSGSDPNP